MGLFEKGDPMFNPYVIILGLFIIAGFIVTLWGWFIIAKARKK